MIGADYVVMFRTTIIICSQFLLLSNVDCSPNLKTYTRFNYGIVLSLSIKNTWMELIMAVPQLHDVECVWQGATQTNHTHAPTTHRLACQQVTPAKSLLSYIQLKYTYWLGATISLPLLSLYFNRAKAEWILQNIDIVMHTGCTSWNILDCVCIFH